MQIPYEVKVIGELEKEDNNVYINIGTVRLTDGEKLLDFSSYDLDNDACDITVSILSHALVKILENENIPFDDFMGYLKDIHIGGDNNGEEEKTDMQNINR